MNQTICKYDIQFKEKFIIKMPKESQILCIHRDEKTNKTQIWVLVYPDNEKEDRLFELFVENKIIQNDTNIFRKYVGTVQYQNDEFVGHLFERY